MPTFRAAAQTPEPRGHLDLTAEKLAGVIDPLMDGVDRQHKGPGAVVVGGDTRRHDLRQGLWAGGHRSEAAVHHGRDAGAAGIDLQALHGHRGDATGRCRQARSRPRRQRLHRFHDSDAGRRRAGDAAPPADPSRRLRGALQGIVFARCRTDAARQMARGRPAASAVSEGRRRSLFQLRLRARRLRRRTRLGRAVRGLRPAPHPRPARA